MYNPRFSLSTWSLHGLITSGTPLIGIPKQMATHGINLLEVCHFHFPSTEPDYLTGFKDALEAAGVTLHAVLIDTGDIVSPDEDKCLADMQAIRDWIDVASVLGAQCVRVCAGLQSPTDEIVEKSASSLLELYDYADARNVRVITENWLLSSLQPGPLLKILQKSGRNLGLCADTGNAEGPDKYETLKMLLPRATSVHFKARYTERRQIDLVDLDRCLELIEESGFDGPITLIYGDTTEEWDGIDTLMGAIVSGLDVLTV